MRKRQKSEKTRRSSSLLIIIAVLLLISIFGLYFPNSIVVVSSIIIALILILLEITSSGKRNYFDRNEANKKDSEEQQDDENNSEEKMIYIGTIAAGLAHEVRNPLNAIDFNIRMIQEDLESGEWEKDDIKERFSSTYKEIKHLERLVSDFLLYARKMALQIGETDIISLLNSTKAMLVEEVSKRKIDIIIESDEKLSPIEADREMLKQAFFNIAKNGIEAMEDGGVLKLRCYSKKDRQTAVIEIIDNGKGISPRDLRKVFHLFYTTRRSGTGLGLPVAQSIIENHNGWIEVKSKQGIGTTFVINLPFKHQKKSS